MTMAEQRELLEQSNQLYERYGKPLEADHWGAYVAIFPDGRTVIGPTLQEVEDQALAMFGRGSFVHRIGPRAVGKIR